MSVQSSIDQALRYLTGTAPVRTAFKRVTTTTSGDTLLGIGSSVTSTDVQLDPQPVFTQLGDKASVLSTTNLVLGATDYQFTVSASALSAEDLMQSTLSIVLKGPDVVVEEFQILGYTSAILFGSYLTFTLYARSKSRQ